MDWMFFLRSLETGVAILAMTFSIAAIRPFEKKRIGISALFLFVTCGLFTFIYKNFHYSVSEKIFIPTIVILLGYLFLINSSDRFAVNLFNFFTQFIIYSAVTMLCTVVAWKINFKTDIFYLLLRAIIFILIVLFEKKYIREKFRYLAELTLFENSVWYVASLGVTLFAILIVSLSVYPVMYYERSPHELIAILIVYILLVVIYHVFYIAIHNTIQKYELIHSGLLLNEKLAIMEKYKQLSEIDMLTGVLNRRAFQEQAQYNLESGQGIALIMMDIDNFKPINDSFGHDVGDQALKILALTLKNSFRGCDNIGRVGGDEFVVMLNKEQMSEEQMSEEQIMKRVIIFKEMLSRQIDEQKELVHFSVSVGIAYANGETDFNRLYKRADTALYQAKVKGKNCEVFFNE